MLTCLTCHDGNYASGAMMKNKLYETLPSTYGSASTIPRCWARAAAAAESTSTSILLA